MLLTCCVGTWTASAIATAAYMQHRTPSVALRFGNDRLSGLVGAATEETGAQTANEMQGRLDGRRMNRQTDTDRG